MDEQFASGSVPVSVAARVYGKDASWVRAGIISGWLPIGKATRNLLYFQMYIVTRRPDALKQESSTSTG